MKRIVLAGLLMLGLTHEICAQSMTDDQVVAYAKERNGNGADPKTIGTELLAKGATREQLQRLYQAYQSGTGSSTAQAATPIGINRDRVNNGEEAPTAVSEAGRAVFGRDIFRSKNLSFEPNMSMAIAQTYVLGPGDEIILDIHGASQSSNKYKITPEGNVIIPRVGPVSVSGMTVEKAQARVQSILGEHYQNSSIQLSVGQTRTISINVMGEVLTPGTYTLSAFATVFHALYMAGGTSSIGTLRDIQVARNGKIISTVDVYEYILNGRLAGSVELQDNDVIIVAPYHNLVNISGNVKRPMWYEMKKGESLASIVSYCGGFTGAAYSKDVRVERRAGDKLSVYNVEEFDFNSFVLADEDHVIVGGNENRYANLAVIQGAVKRPGNYNLDSVHSLKGLVEAAGGLQEDAQTTRAVLIRLTEDRSREAITIDLAGIMKGTTADVPLKNEDHIQIASLATIHDEQTLTIEGEVYNPGNFPFAHNTTIEDLITLAGGLRESASLLNVEVARRIVDPSAASERDIRSETFNFSLTDGLAVENGNTFVLRPYDRVYIRRSPVYNVQRSVRVQGEIMFAGDYVLQDQSTRISDIIARAGGIKQKGVAHNARLERQMNQSERARQDQILRMVQTANDSIDSQHLDVTYGSYTVGVDLQKAIDNPGCDDDIVLRDGDVITIPQVNNTVKINGEVLYANTVSYIKGAALKHYINEAGGYTKESLKRKTYIIYANGHVSRGRKAKIEPGCEIVVPTKQHKQTDIRKTTIWSSTITGLITSIALVFSVLK